MPRTKGSKNKPTCPTVEHNGTKCVRCGSTKRTPYVGSYEKELSGTFNGQVFNLIHYRRTSCSDCGQQRIDKEYVLEAVNQRKSKRMFRPRVEEPKSGIDCIPDPNPPAEKGKLSC